MKSIVRVFIHLAAFVIIYSSVAKAETVVSKKAETVTEKRAENIAEIRFEQHAFTPATLEVRAGQPLMLTITNAGSERIEFESFKLNREKVIEPGQSIVLRFPALRDGSYDFFDDFHQDIQEGVIVAH